MTIDRMREVEKRYAQDIVVRSQELRNAEQSRALLVAAVGRGPAADVLLITTGVARSLVRPLRRLRREALEVAGERLPAYVQQCASRVTASSSPRCRRSGSCPATRSARSRGRSTRFTGRRYGWRARRPGYATRSTRCSSTSPAGARRWWNASSPWSKRLERGERDDQRLADLFKLDHLATRMRRNSENLLVLAGQEVARRWRQPVELMDVVRASLSEVENYERVVTRVNPRSPWRARR